MNKRRWSERNRSLPISESGLKIAHKSCTVRTYQAIAVKRNILIKGLEKTSVRCKLGVETKKCFLCTDCCYFNYGRGNVKVVLQCTDSTGDEFIDHTPLMSGMRMS